MTSTQRRALLRAAIPLSVGLLAAGLPRAHAQSAAKLIRGAGATFPAPLYQKWIEAFEAAHPDLDVEYDAVGSGEGVSRLGHGLGRLRRQRRRDDRRADRQGRRAACG